MWAGVGAGVGVGVGVDFVRSELPETDRLRSRVYRKSFCLGPSDHAFYVAMGPKKSVGTILIFLSYAIASDFALL